MDIERLRRSNNKTNFLDKSKIQTIWGLYDDGIVFHGDDYYIATSFRIFRETFHNKIGFFNIVWDESLDMWQYVQGCEIFDEKIIEMMGL